MVPTNVSIIHETQIDADTLTATLLHNLKVRGFTHIQFGDSTELRTVADDLDGVYSIDDVGRMAGV